MDLWRMLLVGAIVVAAVFLLLPAPEEIPALPSDAVLVEEGTYAIEQDGQSVGEEAFSLWAAGTGYRIESRLVRGGRTIAATLVLDRAWNPLSFTEKGPVPVALRIVAGRPRLATGSGIFRREVAFDAFPPFAFLGVEAVGPWLAAYRYFQSQARSAVAQATAVLPGRRTTMPVVGFPPEPVSLVAAGREIPAEVYRVRLGDEHVELYGQGDLLLGGRLGAGRVFYLTEILPDGLQVAP